MSACLIWGAGKRPTQQISWCNQAPFSVTSGWSWWPICDLNVTLHGDSPFNSPVTPKVMRLSHDLRRRLNALVHVHTVQARTGRDIGHRLSVLPKPIAGNIARTQSDPRPRAYRLQHITASQAVPGSSLYGLQTEAVHGVGSLEVVSTKTKTGCSTFSQSRAHCQPEFRTFDS